jgi:ribonuclease HI
MPKAKTGDSRAAELPAGLALYCDGCCEPNPGVGGWGLAVFQDGVEVHAEFGGSTSSTNNEMELTGAKAALSWVAANAAGVPFRLFCDSMYVVRGCNDWRHGWKASGWRRGGPNAKPANSKLANEALWRAIDAALIRTPVILEWVKGHAGVVGNVRADALANEGIAMMGAIEDTPSLIEQQLYDARYPYDRSA